MRFGEDKKALLGHRYAGHQPGIAGGFLRHPLHVKPLVGSGRTEKADAGFSSMEYVIPVIIFAAWLLLARVVLPRLGVPT